MCKGCPEGEEGVQGSRGILDAPPSINIEQRGQTASTLQVDTQPQSKTGEPAYSATGYPVAQVQGNTDAPRVLTAEDAARIARVRVLASQFLAELNSIKSDHLPLDPTLSNYSEAYRWLAIARTHIQEGAAAAVRSIARPAPDF